MGCLEEGIVERQFVHLACRDAAHLFPPVAEVDAPQARHRIEDLMAFAVGEVNALGPSDDARAFFRQFVVGGEGMHVMCGVQRLKFGGRQMIRDG